MPPPLPDLHVFAPRFVALDVETTGGRDVDRVTEIALIEFEGEQVAARRVTLVNPLQRIPPMIVRHIGITDAMVRTAPTFERLAQRLHDRLRGQVVVGHNLAFDRRMLDLEFRRFGLAWPQTAAEICTLRLARLLKTPKPNLAAACLTWGVQLQQHHRAAHDAEACGRLLLAMRAHLER